MDTQNVDESATSPTAESPKTEKPESTEAAPVLNGEASKDEIASEAPKTEAATPVEEEVKKEEPVADEPAKEEAKEEPKIEEPKVEEPKPVEEAESPKVPEPVTESAPSPQEQEEPATINPPTEETKEVRNEELPPPLPSSNPPSSVTVFAESTKADILTTQIDLLQAAPVETPKEVIKSETPTYSDPKLPAEISQKPDILSEKSSETKVATKPEIEPVISTEIPTESPIKAAVESESIRSITEVSESQPTISESSLSEIKAASESLTSVPDPQLSEPEPKNILEEISVAQSSSFESKVTSVESEISLEPQSAETNLLKDIVPEKSITEVQNTEIAPPEPSVENVLPEQSIIEPSASEKPESVVTKKIAMEAAEPKSEPLVDLDIIPNPVASEVHDEKSEPELKSEPTNIASEISDSSLDAANKTEPIESISSLPSQEPVISIVPKTVELDTVNNVSEVKDKISSEIKDDIVLPALPTENEEQTVIPPADLPDVPSEILPPTELSLVNSEGSANTLAAPESLPEIPVSSVESVEESKVDDIEQKSGSDDFPVDLPSPNDLPPPASVSLDRVVDPADSLPDISTESLPSLPEPVSENLAEPMSLPPVESVPEPIATDCVSSGDSVPLPPPVLTNGNTNGLHSPSEEDALTLKEGPLKQVPPVAPSETSKEEGENAAPAEVVTVEE
ncbi:uncharacterized protein [Diabrotica undecimpunctata]|uniref:uncharacterized protein isoform X3 n=1 Tax=Diabrotica undecimpunctata TaxID=50387 RepID=UPI003B63DDD6